MKAEELSNRFQVRQLDGSEADKVFALYQSNPQYFEAMNDTPSLESVKADMVALPPKKKPEDKHYLGFFDENRLLAVMDLIEAYPDSETAFIGLFMVDGAYHNQGIGSSMISEVLFTLKTNGFSRVRLGYIETNIQSEAFWYKNGFAPTGTKREQKDYTVIVMQKELIRN